LTSVVAYDRVFPEFAEEHPVCSARKYDLVCFDVDGTLIRHPSDKVIWEILNLRFTGDDRVNRERYRMYLDGKIDYAEWVRLDVGGWIEAGATREGVVEAVREFEIYDGALETVHALKARGVHLAVISGTIDVVIDTLFPDHPFADVFTNKILFDGEGRVSGWEATPYDLDGKPLALRDVASRHGVALERTAFVGDGENDVPLAAVAGCLVAFNPRSAELERRADCVMKNRSMIELLDVLGFND
jgi:HAD superfamily PSPase-like hydrolase